jgi:hypothetical protein
MRKKLVFFTGLSVCLTFLIVACSKSSEDILSGSTTTTPITTCDTTLVTYSVGVVGVMKANCYSCHGSGSTGGSGGIDLSTYALLSKWAINGYLIGNVTHATGYVGMPYGQPKMDACSINTIVAWVHQGVKNN